MMGNDLLEWTEEPEDARAFSQEFDAFYTGFSHTYDRLLKLIPFWGRWLETALPFIEGPRVLEVAFGTGYLMSEYAGEFDVYGLDLNTSLIEITRANLRRAGLDARLTRGSVEALPYEDAYFDTVLCTMAFSGFPDGVTAMGEMTRVLQSGGRLVMVDVSLPADGNWPGMLIARGFEAAGDILRDMTVLLDRFGYGYEITAVGGFGSIQRMVAVKDGAERQSCSVA